MKAEPGPAVGSAPRVSAAVGFIARRLGCGAALTGSAVQVVAVLVVVGALLPFRRLSMVNVARLVGEVVEALLALNPAFSRLLRAPLSIF